MKIVCKFCGNSCLMSGYDEADCAVWECGDPLCGKFTPRHEPIKNEKPQAPKMVRTKNGSLCEVWERNGAQTILKFGRSYFYYDIALCTKE